MADLITLLLWTGGLFLFFALLAFIADHAERWL